MSNTPNIFSIILVKILSNDGVYQYLISKEPEYIASILPILSSFKVLYFFENIKTDLFLQLIFDINKEQLKYILNNIHEDKLISLIKRMPRDHLKDLISHLKIEKKKNIIKNLELNIRILILINLSYPELEYIIPNMDIQTIKGFLSKSPIHNLTSYFNLLSKEQKTGILSVLHERLLAHIVPRWDNETERSELLLKLEKENLISLLKNLSPITINKIIVNWEKDFVFSIFFELPKDLVSKLLLRFEEDIIAEFLDHLDLPSKAEIINTFTLQQAYKVISRLSEDDRDDIINDLEPSMRLSLRSKFI